MLVNLLSNAVKFTPSGEIAVNVKREDTGDESLRLRFEVADTGVGISKSSMERVFESFSQADSSTTRHFGGTGLGLAICKRLVGLMGGEIGVDSTAGEGSTFWFTTALEAAGPLPASNDPLDIEPVRTLIVDDNATNRLILERQLTSWGIACDSAADGVAALAALGEAVRSGAPYGLVLLDFQMPGMNGLELATAINSDDSLRPVRLLMLTSAGSGRAAATGAGIAGFVTKPVRQLRLREEITRVMQATSAEAAALTDPTALPPPPDENAPLHLVLVAEDQPVNRLVATRMLEMRGCQVDVAANGREAVVMHQATNYEAIFMDCQMPELDGYQATVEIRLHEGAIRHTPIIAMTANTMRGDRARCLASGMDDYLGKPLQPELLDQALARAFGSDDVAGLGVIADNAHEEPDDRPEMLDPSVLKMICAGDARVREELVTTFLDQTQARIDELALAFAEDDSEGVLRTAHSLKGSAAVIGANQLSAIAAEIDAIAQAGRFSEALPLQADLESVYAMTAAVLTAHDECEVLT